MEGHDPSAEKGTIRAITGDFVFFGMGQGFLNQATVVPALLATLTTSAPLIGLASAIVTGGFLLPQLFAANRISARARRKPFVAAPVTLGRSLLVLFVPVFVLCAPRAKPATLAIFYAVYAVFWVTDGIATVGWLDILGRCLRPTPRARLFTVGPLASALAGVAAAAGVSFFLSTPALRWPWSYAACIIAACACWTASLVSFLQVREVPLATPRKPLPWPDYFRRLFAVARGDARLRRGIAAQLCVAGLGVATPFYVVFGLERLGLPATSVGVFTAAQVAGGVLGSLLMGRVGEKRGTRAVMRLGAVIAMAAPALGATAAILPLGDAFRMALLGVAFGAMGVQGSSSLAGFTNWVLEHAPDTERPLYIGIANTMNGLSFVMPLVGGWLLAASGSWTALFAAAAVGPAAALLLLRRLPDPRHDATLPA